MRRIRDREGARSTTSPPGARWPKSTATTGISGRSRCAIRMPTASPSSPKSIGTQSISIAGCSGNSMSNWPPRSPPRCRAGMSLGIMHDLAVGVHPDGADAWALQDVAGARRYRRRTAG